MDRNVSSTDSIACQPSVNLTSNDHEMTSNDSEWETTSENSDELPASFERPVQKQDISKLAEIPVRTLVQQSKTVSWLGSVLNYSNPHKGYERLMVRAFW